MGLKSVSIIGQWFDNVIPHIILKQKIFTKILANNSSPDFNNNCIILVKTKTKISTLNLRLTQVCSF